mmetsp:Transcript_13847/g.45787  ORF Transcript_13847/g.45787 Transcript_13847/m.45787 type:complete len:222 (-) Transcript_13847:1261-1926(-)
MKSSKVMKASPLRLGIFRCAGPPESSQVSNSLSTVPIPFRFPTPRFPRFVKTSHAEDSCSSGTFLCPLLISFKSPSKHPSSLSSNTPLWSASYRIHSALNTDVGTTSCTFACSSNHAPLFGRQGASTYSLDAISARRDAARSHANASSTLTVPAVPPLATQTPGRRNSSPGVSAAVANSFTLCSYKTSMNVMNLRIKSTLPIVSRGICSTPTVWNTDAMAV